MINELTQKEFDRIREYIKQNFGISLNNEKKTLIYSRLRSELEDKKFSDFTKYFDYLISDKTGEAIVKFIDKVTTNHTFFMRESDHFDYLKQTVLPYIAQTYSAQKDLRLWCAASSSGEEPYTLQMIVTDFFADKPGWNIETLATDISTKVLDKAAKGVYSADSVNTLPKEWVKKYFKQIDTNNYEVVDDIKKRVFFRKFNLMEEKMPFKKRFQVIFCRNVMIYFDNETKESLIERFAGVLEPEGYLFIGHSESLNQGSKSYKYLMPAVYRRI